MGFPSPVFLPKASTVILEASCKIHLQRAATVPTWIYPTRMLSLIFQVDMKDRLPLSCLQKILHMGVLSPCPCTSALPILCHTNEALLKHLPICSSTVPQQSYSRNCFLIRHHGHTKHDLGSLFSFVTEFILLKHFCRCLFVCVEEHIAVLRCAAYILESFLLWIK